MGASAYRGDNHGKRQVRHSRTVDSVRFGLAVRSLRRRRHWTQAELARRAGCSRSAVARVERAEADRFTVRFLERLLAALDARVLVRVLWRGEDLDRLLDADHAALVEKAASMLAATGWVVRLEVTFQVRGERGSIDVLALRPDGRAALVVEVKSVVPDIQAMLAALDRKVRLLPLILRDRGWGAGGEVVSRVVVLSGDRTSRRRIDRHAATFARALPARTVAVRRWLASPSGELSGLWFVSGVTSTGTRHRIGSPRRAASTCTRPSSVTGGQPAAHLTQAR
jgi:transcriptional regulator with XRE-family HTH domain